MQPTRSSTSATTSPPRAGGALAAATLAGCALLAACSLERRPLLGDAPDARVPPSDIGVLDTRPNVDTHPSMDVPPSTDRDAPTVEPIDTGVDAPIDTGSDAGARPTCNELFMPVIRAYRNCGPPPEPGTCRFYADPEPSASCDTLCALVSGSTCLASEADDDTLCGSTSSVGCDQTQGDTICICRRP